MRKIIIFLVTAVITVSFFAKIANAKEPNNKFGIHIVDENDLDDAAALVNSSGGEWGYVTFVIREDERNNDRWQKAFDKMRRLKLIPIVRLATKMTPSGWEIPKDEEATNWAGFLNSLNWPVKDRYIILFNEPNHDKEWGGKADPAGYAKAYRHYYETLKNFSPDFFILPAALDLAAPNGKDTISATTFYEGMHQEDNYIFTIYDALNSHSYPNPGFSGKATDLGRTSINGYKWELNYLSDFGINQDIPVFITETGWVNTGGNLEENYKYAFDHVWDDDQIVAVTPFLLSYLDQPFSQFSWKNPETKEFYPQFYSVQSMTKLKGEPKQKNSFEFVSNDIANYLVSDSEYSFSFNVKNTGQSIWNAEDGFSFKSESTLDEKHIRIGDIKNVEPGQTAKVNIRINTDEPRGIHSIKIGLYKNDKKIGNLFESQFTLVSPPTLSIYAKFWFGNQNQTASLSLYEDNVLVTKYDDLIFTDGKAIIPALKNVIPNKDYEFSLSKTFFLPNNKKTALYVGNNNLDFGRLIPIDFNNDEKITPKDVLAYAANPLLTKMLLLPR